MKNYNLPEENYKPDAQICDRYISFSSELLRLSLIAIGGYGALVAIFLKDKSAELAALRCSWGLFVSVLLFCACAGTTLIHRFYASDSMSWYVTYLRAQLNENSEEAQKERTGLRTTLKVSEWALIFAEVFFAAAVIAFIWGFYQLLFMYAK